MSSNKKNKLKIDECMKARNLRYLAKTELK